MLALWNNLHAAPVWRNRQSTGLVVESSQVQYPVILWSCSDRRQVVHTHVTKLYKLLPAKGSDALKLGR